MNMMKNCESCCHYENCGAVTICEWYTPAEDEDDETLGLLIDRNRDAFRSEWTSYIENFYR